MSLPTFDTLVPIITDHFLEVLYFDLGRYLIAAGAMTAILFAFRGWAARRRIQNRHPTRADYAREFWSSVRTVLVFAVVSLATLAMREAGLVHVALDSAPLLTIAWQTVLMVLAHDAYFYWMHRAIHTRRLFRMAHLHHHKSRTPTPWAAYSFAVIEAALEVAFVPLFLLATSQAGIVYTVPAILIFLWHMIARNVIGHAGHEIYPSGWLDNPFTRWWTTVTHHDLHHSEGRWNYGFYFTWWDKWMGTEHPQYRERFAANARPLGIRLPRFAKATEGIAPVIVVIGPATLALAAIGT